MRKLVIDVPDFVDTSEQDLKMILASRLFEAGKLSAGQAAEMVGYSKRSFIELLGSYNVSLFNYGPDDLERDVVNARTTT